MLVRAMRLATDLPKQGNIISFCDSQYHSEKHKLQLQQSRSYSICWSAMYLCVYVQYMLVYPCSCVYARTLICTYVRMYVYVYLFISMCERVCASVSDCE